MFVYIIFLPVVLCDFLLNISVSIFIPICGVSFMFLYFIDLGTNPSILVYFSIAVNLSHHAVPVIF